MQQRIFLAVVLAVLILAGVSAHAYDFWGITVGTQLYNGSRQLVFDGVSASGAQCAVGSYGYTRVDSSWYGAHGPASPGLGYNNIHRSWDAMGIFFKAEETAARFMIFTGMPYWGITAAEVGYGNREFGPGDLKIDVGGHSYGVGLRMGGLYWGTTDPGPSKPWFRILNPNGGAEAISARNAGTLGVVEMDPDWARVGHQELAPGCEDAYAFYISGSGDQIGAANVNISDTGLKLGGYGVYAYEVRVGWDVLGLDKDNYSFRASWRPDCGNDLIAATFSNVDHVVPEPAGIIPIISGIIGLGIIRKKR